MPVIRKDKKSGALIFSQTPEEKQIGELKKQNVEISKRLENLEKLLGGTENARTSKGSRN